MTAELQNLLEIGEGATALRLWTGQGRVSSGGWHYEGTGQALEVGPIEQRRGDPEQRVTITISVIPFNERARFLQDVGPLPVTIRLVRVHRLGQAITLTLLSPTYKGKLSEATMQDGALTVEIESLLGDRIFTVPANFSHADQQRAHPGDLGFEHSRALEAQGLEAAWPPVLLFGIMGAWIAHALQMIATAS